MVGVLDRICVSEEGGLSPFATIVVRRFCTTSDPEVLIPYESR
jgi:hypothetical protein